MTVDYFELYDSSRRYSPIALFISSSSIFFLLNISESLVAWTFCKLAANHTGIGTAEDLGGLANRGGGARLLLLVRVVWQA